MSVCTIFWCMCICTGLWYVNIISKFDHIQDFSVCHHRYKIMVYNFWFQARKWSYIINLKKYRFWKIVCLYDVFLACLDGSLEKRVKKYLVILEHLYSGRCLSFCNALWLVKKIYVSTDDIVTIFCVLKKSPTPTSLFVVYRSSFPAIFNNSSLFLSFLTIPRNYWSINHNYWLIILLNLLVTFL